VEILESRRLIAGNTGFGLYKTGNWFDIAITKALRLYF
jgi:hypothetical protein